MDEVIQIEIELEVTKETDDEDIGCAVLDSKIGFDMVATSEEVVSTSVDTKQSAIEETVDVIKKSDDGITTEVGLTSNKIGYSKSREDKSLETKIFYCNICGKNFSPKKDFESHYLTNVSDLKPFQCCICKAKFSRKSNLNKHGLIHIGEKPFKCDVCDKRFTRKDVLKNQNEYWNDFSEYLSL